MAGPIFLLGIQRGGTNQVLNILRSHPRTYWPQGEFHEVFRISNLRSLRGLGLRRALRMARAYAPIRLTAGDILNPDRRPEGQGLLSGPRGRAVADGLARSAATNADAVGRHKAALRERGLIDPSTPDRLFVKVMNYNLAFAEDLAALYPDATFVGLIRDGRAVCEGHVARGGDLAAAAALYDFVGRRLIELPAKGLRLRTWRFENLLADPERIAGEIYEHCGLERAAARGVCLQDKERIVDARGRVRGIRKTERFYTFAQMAEHMRADANEAALARLPAAARAAIEERCHGVLAGFDYLPRADTPLAEAARA